MKLYYTVSSQTDDPQSKPSLSIGGFKSSTEAQNDVSGSFFDQITPYTIRKNLKEYIGLILVNETGGDITNASIWFDYPEGNFSIYKIAAVDLTDDQMERVRTRNSRPLSATFYEADGESNAQNIGDILTGEAVGLWIERSLVLDNIQDICNIESRLTQTTENGLWTETPLETEENININIKWD